MQNKSPVKKEKMFNKKVPLSVTLLICVAAMLIIFVQYISGGSGKKIAQSYVQPAPACNVQMNQLRMNEFEFTHPLLISDVNSESENFKDLKSYLALFIAQKKVSGALADASVYFRKLGTGEYISVNGAQEFMPGSIFKVPILITYLKEAEKNPKLLNKEIFSGKNNSNALDQSFEEKLIDENKNYSVKELLEHMIVQSDNFAATRLLENMDVPAFQKLFTELGMEKPDIYNQNITTNAIDFAKFFRVLYNSSYLNDENSEYALSLLSQSTFREGILKQLPQDIKAVHKFGEAGAPGEKQLHEAAIIYGDNCTYLLVVMTKGKSVNALSPILSGISKYVYYYMTGNGKAC